ncbi:glycoside hydrolase family 3 protein [Bailinhaonella thermotolerans]|uniref:Glycoside hydrolase family 3 protein n=1 Tax=Bailinhaonella thermotolerans TaxID=1070861 RepID=A0A3A4AD04_9ACTN|nr:glycoside hydrolase family 3 protein [Bailinhaonella thermotolerans]RJL26545.1 glycoside hydrolase family 3 protein [Bailinhaonella thermotolerans]
MSAERELRRMAAGTLLVPFTGTVAPDWVKRGIADGLGGVTLFGFNVAGPDQLRELNAELRAHGDPVISLDEEGGDVTRLHYHVGSPYPGNAALGSIDDVELTESVHRALGRDLAAVGVNLDMAPSADVNTADDNPVIGTRSFGNDPALVARHTVAAVRGLQAAGIAACVKHFPGHGATRQDSHLEIPLVDADLDLLGSRELVPFRAAIEAGTQTIMTAHVRVPALTGDAPATLSPAALTGLLRDGLGFEGVVITDAMDMKAITESVGLPGGCALSIAAGSDLVCLGPLPTQEDVTAIIDAIVAAVRDGSLPLSRLEEAADRTARLRAWFHTAGAAAPGATRDGSGDGAGIGLAAARRAVRLEGTPAPLVDPLVVRLETPPTIAVGEVPWGLTLPGGEHLPADPENDHADAIVERAAGRSLVVVLRDAHRYPATQKLVAELLTHRPDAAIVEMGLPIWRPSAASVYVAAYGGAKANAQATAELLTT